MYKIGKSIEMSDTENVIWLEDKLLDGKVEITEPYLKELRELMVRGTETIESELEKFLFEHKYLLEEAEAVSEVKKLNRILEETLIFTILPTEKCNFRCIYCYENHEAENMSDTTLNHIKQFLKEELENKELRYIQINWFGGEPTLCIKQIEDFNEYVLGLKSEYGFHFSSGITTNGYLLNRELFKKLYALGISSYQITLDGWNHDNTRIHVSGEKTLAHIVENLKEISGLPEDYDFEVWLRYNISKDNQDYSWYDYMKELFGNDMRFMIYINFVRDWGGNDVKKVSLCSKKEIPEMERKHVEYMERINLRTRNSADKKFTALSNVCYAAYLNSYIFRPDNDVVKCSVALEEKENIIGHTDMEKGVVINRQQEKLWTETTIDNCGNCDYLISCLHKACPKLMVVDKMPSDGCFMPHERSPEEKQ